MRPALEAAHRREAALEQTITELHDRIVDLESQNERVRRALSDHERDRASLERIESKLDQLIAREIQT
jgi:hypothetical protein